MKVELIDVTYNKNIRFIILIGKSPEISRSYVLIFLPRGGYCLKKLLTVNQLLVKLSPYHSALKKFKSIIPIGFSISVLIDNILFILLEKAELNYKYKINMMNDFYIKDNNDFLSIYCRTTNYVSLT